jgi:response regulator NasT
MGNIIISMPKKEDALRIADIIVSRGMLPDIDIAVSGADVLRIAQDRDFGVIVCTAKLRDMSCSEIADYMPKYFGMIVLTKDVDYEADYDRVVKLLMPFKHSDLCSTIEMMLSDNQRRIRREKGQGPRRSGEEQKILDKAKQILIEVNGMSEPEAFRYIQKSSMDNSRTLMESAQMIIALFQN